MRSAPKSKMIVGVIGLLLASCSSTHPTTGGSQPGGSMAGAVGTLDCSVG